MLNETATGTKFTQLVLVKEVNTGIAKNGTKYARGVMLDNSATVKFICFDELVADKLITLENSPAMLTGIMQLDSYSKGRQIKVENVEKTEPEADLSNLPQQTIEVDIEAGTRRFMELCNSVQRQGIAEFVAWLLTTDFFAAPASTMHHGAYEGGLLEHALSTYDNLIRLSELYSIELPAESLIITSLFHDVCKTGMYIKQQRSVKKDGNWISVDGYAIEDKLPLGQGEKSVMLLMKYMELTDAEMLAIRWHMGGWDESAQGYGGGKAISATFSSQPLAILLHMADMADNYLCGRR